jgi:hypothetical protein
VISVRLDTIRSNAYAKVKCRDATHYVFYKDGAEQYEGDLYEDAKTFYEDWNEHWKEASQFMEENPMVFSTKVHYLTKIWKQVPTEESSVVRLWYDENDQVHALTAAGHHVVLKEGKVLAVTRDDKGPPAAEELEAVFAGVTLPARPGRQYIAKASAWAELTGGRKIIGTQDGMLAILSTEGKVFSLGIAAQHGPIHDMAATKDKKTVYGVGGDPSDIGMVFSYNDDNGLTIYGRVYTNSNYSVGGLGASCEPYCIALSQDDTRLAIGARDRMGCVFEYDLTSGIKPVFLD